MKTSYKLKWYLFLLLLVITFPLDIYYLFPLRLGDGFQLNKVAFIIHAALIPLTIKFIYDEFYNLQTPVHNQ